MKEESKDLFSCAFGNDAICITTNAIVKKNGLAVMGAGVAKAAKERFKGIESRLGSKLNKFGNHVFLLGTSVSDNDGGTYYVFSFPTKNDWRDNSDIELIKQSCAEIVNMCDKYGIKKCYIPRPGCSNGHLDWLSCVKPEISGLLDDRFVILDKRQ